MDLMAIQTVKITFALIILVIRRQFIQF